MAKVGRKVQRERLAVIGKYIDEALQLAGMTRAELARRAKNEPSTVTRVCQENRTVKRETLLEWCQIMECPDWLQALILNAAGYASEDQREKARTDQALTWAEQQTQEELKRRQVQK